MKWPGAEAYGAVGQPDARNSMWVDRGEGQAGGVLHQHVETLFKVHGTRIAQQAAVVRHAVNDVVGKFSSGGHAVRAVHSRPGVPGASRGGALVAVGPVTPPMFPSRHLGARGRRCRPTWSMTMFADHVGGVSIGRSRT